ncbi:MAG: hypothetical protein NXI24_00675 [bacterium]|nr:hypothetical protein [bacterium]
MSESEIPPIPGNETPQPAPAANGGEQNGDATHETGRPQRSFRESVRYWLSVIPGTKRDYFLITLGILDSIVILFSTNLIALFPFVVTSAIVAFDISVVVIWGLFFLHRFLKEKDRWSYVSYHWYEVIGLVPIPLSSLRLFLLLRAVKLVIAYYKLGRAEQDVSQLLTRDLTFRFRDAIVDTIADAVFMQSLNRVEEVMMTLDYEKVSRAAMERHREDLRATVEESLSSKSMIGELRRIPLMGVFADRLTKDVGLVVAEILEQKVLGDIMRDVSSSVLAAMHTRLRDIGVDRIAPVDARLAAAAQRAAAAAPETPADPPATNGDKSAPQ